MYIYICHINVCNIYQYVIILFVIKKTIIYCFNCKLSHILLIFSMIFLDNFPIDIFVHFHTHDYAIYYYEISSRINACTRMFHPNTIPNIQALLIKYYIGILTTLCSSHFPGDRQFAVVRARQQERQHMADRLRQDSDTTARHQYQPYVRVGGGQPRGRLPDRYQQPVGHIHRDERHGGGGGDHHVPGHAHRSHSPVRSRLNYRHPFYIHPPTLTYFHCDIRKQNIKN